MKDIVISGAREGNLKKVSLCGYHGRSLWYSRACPVQENPRC